MISGIDLSQTIDFSLPGDVENPTIWKLGIIPSYIFARLTTEASKSSGEIDATFKIIQLGLKGWENFDKKFETETVKMFGRDLEIVPLKLVESIPFSALIKLSEKILELNQITDDERKN